MDLRHEVLCIDRRHRGSHRLSECDGIAGRANEIATAERTGWEKDELFLRPVEREVPVMAHDADYGVRLRLIRAQPRKDGFAQWRLLSVRQLGGLVVDHNQLRVRVVVLRLREETTRNK